MAHADSMTREDWIHAALGALRVEGHSGLRAAPLAAKLGVTRGSFYWHFEDVGALHDVVLQRWKETATDGPIALTSGKGAAQQRLRDLVIRAFSAPPETERAVQSWAREDPRAAKAVDAVNERRLQHLNTLLLEMGLSKAAARARASIIYWALLGRIQAPHLPGGPERVRQFCELLGVSVA
jgi:AcrR family transcriptional regulator